MSNLLQAMTRNEVHKLETILQAHKHGKAFDLIGLDGFLHGILCLSKPVNPTEWLQTALTEETVSKDEKSANEVVGLVFRYINGIALPAARNEAFAPRCDGSPEQTKAWMNGFARAFGFDRLTRTKALWA
jgi:yecA family protein